MARPKRRRSIDDHENSDVEIVEIISDTEDPVQISEIQTQKNENRGDKQTSRITTSTQNTPDLTDAYDDLEEEDLVILNEPPKNINERKTLNHVTCCICLDQPDVLVVTPCGHVYCDDCVLRALSSTSRSNTKVGECSICKRRVKYNDIAYLEMKVRSNTLPKSEKV